MNNAKTWLTTLSILVFALLSKAEVELGFGTCEVISEKVNDTITEGYTIISGKVKSKDYTPESFVVGIQNKDVPKVNVMTVVPDKNGRFILRFKASEKVLYCQSSLNNEIVLGNRMYKSKHVTKVVFNSTERDMKEPSLRFPPGVKKPVVYMYSKDAINVDLKLVFSGDLTFTYPKYDGGWTANVNSDGIEVDGEKYPYLFWEGTKKDLFYKKENGAIEANKVKKADVVSYLEKTLKKLGLNPTESADFITFWAPQMIKYDEVVVQFLIDEDYEASIAEMHITPKPDASRRIYLLFSDASKCDTFNLKPQELEQKNLSREGFVLVEWGGSELEIKSTLIETAKK